MTPFSRAIALLLTCSLLTAWATTTAAQSESPTEMMMRDKPPVVPAPDERSPEVEELSLPTYYLEDDSGQLVPVLKRLKYEEWEQIYKAKLELANPDRPPRYALQAYNLSAQFAGEAVDLELEVKLDLMATGWIRIPLRLSRAALTKPLVCAADDQCFLEYESDGYVLWVRVDPPAQSSDTEAEETEAEETDDDSNQDGSSQTDTEAATDSATTDLPRMATAEEPIRRRTYRLHMSVPVTTKADEHELLLDLPRRAVSSEFSLLVPEKLKLIPPPMAKLTREEAGEGMTRVNLTGVSGEFRLRWTQPDIASSSPELDVNSLTLTEIGGPRSIKSTVHMSVRSLSGPLRTFSVLLPPGMQLMPSQGNEDFQVIPADQPMDDRGDRQRVTIELTSPTSDLFEFQLAAAATRTQQEQYTQFDVTGFHVPDAKLTSGYHGLAVEGDWYLHWAAENNNLRQVDVFPEEVETELAAWKVEHVIARFHCLSFPTSLRVRVTPQRSLIQVEPNYQVYVSATKLRLEASLHYRVRGRKLELIEVDLGNWKLADMTPESLVRLEAVVNENGLHSIPLQQATGGDFTLQLNATMPIDAATGKFAFTLPRVQTSQPEREQLTAAPASLAMISDDDVIVTPMIDKLAGLSPEASALVENLPEREQPPRVYRQRTDSNQTARFAGQLQVMPQTVAVDSLAQIAAVDDGFQVDVRLQYTVKHKPLEWLVLEVPRELITPDSIDAELLLDARLQLDGEPIVPTVLPIEEDSAPTALLTLPEMRQGAFELHVEYLWKQPPENDSEPSTAVIELVRPSSDINYASVSSRLTMPQTDRVQVAKASGWERVSVEDNDQVESGTRWQFQADSLLSTIPLRRTPSSGESLRRTNVRLAWYQTWLTSTRRRDRAVFRVESTQGSVELQLPQPGELELVEVVVNGQLRDDLQILPSRNVLLVTLPEQESGEYVIELMYEVATRGASPVWQGGLARFRFPQLIGGDPQRVYWQLVLPSNEYLWFEPAGVTSETKLTMPTWLAPAQPTLEQQQLEQWSGALPTPPPAAGANVYLFSGFGQLDQLSTGIIRRRVVVLLGAGLVLALALPLIYLPSLRGWKSLLAAGVVLLLLGLAFPFLAQLLGSSVVIGCLLVLLARLLQITLSRHRQGPRILPARDSTLGQATQHGYTLDAQGSSHGTTATAPAVYSGGLDQQEASS